MDLINAIIEVNPQASIADYEYIRSRIEGAGKDQKEIKATGLDGVKGDTAQRKWISRSVMYEITRRSDVGGGKASWQRTKAIATASASAVEKYGF